MPRLRIIVLNQLNGDANLYSYCMWADVPTARQSYYANASNKSAWTGATSADNGNLVSGAMVEKVDSLRIPNGTTLAQIEAFLQIRWTNFQSDITAANPWIRYGSTWDGTTWTIQTGA